jgi:hypothetical protein
MACKNVCSLCPHLVISDSIEFTGDALNITIANNGYRNGEKVCIVLAQAIPSETTINAPVNIVVGGTEFPLVNCNCSLTLARQLRSRTRYATRVITNETTGEFRLLGNPCCNRPRVLEALPIVEPTQTNSNEGDDSNE